MGGREGGREGRRRTPKNSTAVTDTTTATYDDTKPSRKRGRASADDALNSSSVTSNK